MCRPQEEKCGWEEGTISVPSCKLERKIKYKPIDKVEGMYQINSPRYHGYSEYPNNTYCVWNVANTGFVSYQIVDQQLEEPLKCDDPGCDCPDSVKITMGKNEITLCGSGTHSASILSPFSFNGLHVKFCSDNKNSAKGFNMLASKIDVEVTDAPSHEPASRKRDVTSEVGNTYIMKSQTAIIV